jgi:hypothetical protein
MSRTTRFAALLATVVLAAAACSDDVSTTPTSTPARQVPSGDIFNRMQHVVVDAIDHEGFETVAVLAHLCTTTDTACPDGDENVMVMAAKHFKPGHIYLGSTDVFVDPPDVCLADDMHCVLSVVHCTFPDAETQARTRYCLPQAEAVKAAYEAAAPTGDPTAHPCIERPEERSHHVSLSCLAGRSRN